LKDIGIFPTNDGIARRLDDGMGEQFAGITLAARHSFPFSVWRMRKQDCDAFNKERNFEDIRRVDRRLCGRGVQASERSRRLWSRSIRSDNSAIDIARAVINIAVIEEGLGKRQELSGLVPMEVDLFRHRLALRA
jgi:hypothetical protein